MIILRWCKWLSNNSKEARSIKKFNDLVHPDSEKFKQSFSNASCWPRIAASLRFLRPSELKHETFLSDLAVVFLVLYKALFYTQPAFFHLQKHFYSVHDNVLAFCFFLHHKDFDTSHDLIDIFKRNTFLNELETSPP